MKNSWEIKWERVEGRKSEQRKKIPSKCGHATLSRGRREILGPRMGVVSNVFGSMRSWCHSRDRWTIIL